MHRDKGADEMHRLGQNVTYVATPEGVRRALRGIRASLVAAKASDEEAFSAELVIAEALNNVVEHALEGMENPSFEISTCLRDNGVVVEIRDRGRQMPDGLPPLGESPLRSEEQESLPEGGFGWFLIRELARDLLYRRESGENILSFRIAICLAQEA